MEATIKSVELETISEEGLDLFVNKLSLSPKRDAAFYDKNIKIVRALVTTALGSLCKNGLPGVTDNRQILCLDGIGGTGVSGLLWKKHIGDKAQVTINDSHQLSCDIITRNVERNKLKTEITKEDTCIILHKRPFHFIYLDCHTSASHFFDAAFRSIVKGGIFSITTKDDCALYGRNPDVALRNYGGVIGKTMYSKELAIRLIIAGMVRSAAKYNKGLKVLCVVAVKSSLTLIVSVQKGSLPANSSLEHLQHLAHCSMCEDRAFLPRSNYLLEFPLSNIACGCQGRLPGQLVLELGPVWSGPLYDPEFLLSLLAVSKAYPWQAQLTEFLHPILAEAWCPKVNEIRLRKKVEEYLEGKTKTPVSDEPPSKKSKTEREEALVIPTTSAPAFYFNLHHHSPKGPKVLPADTVVASLQREGFRASRTHFDPMAVRTNASLKELKNILSPPNVAIVK